MEIGETCPKGGGHSSYCRGGCFVVAFPVCLAYEYQVTHCLLWLLWTVHPRKSTLTDQKAAAERDGKGVGLWPPQACSEIVRGGR